MPQHEYDANCQCYRCKGIRGNPHYRNQGHDAGMRAKLHRKRRYTERRASREVQYARYLDCGPQNWDDRD